LTFGASTIGTTNLVCAGCRFSETAQLTAIALASRSIRKISSFDACAEVRNVSP
jgi:hypothetical protein